MRAILISGLLILFLWLPGQGALAQEPILGEVRYFGFSFCPRGWSEANGQLMEISQNSALFSLLGTIYGGNGRTTFALPDLRGRVPIHVGQGPGLPKYAQGSKGGTATTTLSVEQMPAHSHPIRVSSGTASYSDGTNGVLAASSTNRNKVESYIYDAPGTADQELAEDSLGETGGDESHDNMQPYLTLRACIALTGLYPSRS